MTLKPPLPSGTSLDDRVAQFPVTVQFTRHHLILTCKAPPGAEPGGSFQVTIGGLSFETALPAGTSAVTTIPLIELELLPNLAHRLAIAWPDHQMDLPADPLLAKVDIRNRDEFLERVQALSKRIPDPEAIRFCSRRLLANPGSRAELRAAAICAIGYRIVEGLDPADPDYPRFWGWVESLLAEYGANDNEVRWTTSVTMVAAYAAILQENAPEVIHYLRRTLSYRHHLERLSLLHTNFSRSDTLLALAEMARGNREEAEALLADVAEVFRTGARASLIQDPQRGRYQFSEIAAVLKSVRAATGILNQIEQVGSREELVALAFSTSIGEISILTRQLMDKGHWHGVLEALAKGASDLGAPNFTRARRKPKPPVAPVEAPARLADLPTLIEAAGLPGDAATDAFRRAVACLSAGAKAAVSAGSADFHQHHAASLNALLAVDTRLRAQGTYLWPSLLELSRTRFRLAFLAVMAGDREAGHAALVQTIFWVKEVLVVAVIEHDEDFEPAGVLVLSGLVAYLVAHRYLMPQPRHLGDLLIEADLHRSLHRVFRDDALSQRIVTAFGLQPRPTK